LKKKIYNYNDVVEGTVSICAKQKLEINSIIISLECIQFHKVGGGRTSSVVFKTAIDHPENFLLMPRCSRSISFKLKMPDDHPRAGKAIQLKLPNIPEDSKILTVAKAMDGYHKRGYHWYIHVEVKTPNIVLSGGENVPVTGYTVDDFIAVHKNVKDAFRRR
jgi:hypothetical protein